MSNKPVSGLDIPKYLSEKLNQSSIFTVKDLVTKCPMELMRILNLTLPKVELVLNAAYKTATKIQHATALDLINENLAASNSAQSDSFEAFVSECGVARKGMLCELCGPPGVGKTQFLFQLCSNHLFNDPNASVIFIDTENNFNPNRIREIAKHRAILLGKTDEDLNSILKNVLVFKAFTVADFEKKIEQQLEQVIIKKRTSMIIIDSIASVVRREFSSTDSSVLHERSIFLSRISSRLKCIADLLDVSVVLTNQIVTVTNECNNLAIVPALGGSWAHFVNIRLVLQFIDDFNRQLIIAKSSLTPYKAYSFTINSINGIVLEQSSEYDEYADVNPNNQNIKSKPYSHIAHR